MVLSQSLINSTKLVESPQIATNAAIDNCPSYSLLPWNPTVILTHRETLVCEQKLATFATAFTVTPTTETESLKSQLRDRPANNNCHRLQTGNVRLLPRKLPLGGRTTTGDLTGNCRTGNTSEESRVSRVKDFAKVTFCKVHYYKLSLEWRD